MDTYDKLCNQFKTGDIILFNNNHPFTTYDGIISSVVKYFTKSDWSHIGMIVKDPEFTDKKLEKGLYLWESNLELFPDSEDNKIKMAVQIVPLREMVNHFKGIAVWRKLDCGDVHITNDKLKEIHKLVHGKPYDANPIDWIEAYLEHSACPRKVNTFFCSALVARIYSFLHLIDPKINWSVVRPSSFSKENIDDKTHINLINNAKLLDDVEIKNT